MLETSLSKLKIPPLLWFFLVVLVAVLVARNSGLYPSLFADEYNYSKSMRLLPLSEALLPNYLYLWLYQSINTCGDGFLDCARWINVIFYAAAAPFIFFTACRICGLHTAAFIAAMSLLAPINVYTALLTPEAFYFLSFWIFTWFILHPNSRVGPWHWALAGILLGLSSLVKPHSLLILPAICLYIIFLSCNGAINGFARGCAHALVAATTTFLTKFFIGFLIAGEAALSLFGSFYNAKVADTPHELSYYTQLGLNALDNVVGHGLALSLLFGLPMAIAILLSWRLLRAAPPVEEGVKLAVLTLLLFANLVAVAALFTALTNGAGPYETLYRLHMRYYSFAFPLLLMVAAYGLQSSGLFSLRQRLSVGIPIAALALLALYTRMAPYKTSFADNPLLHGVNHDSWGFYGLGGLAALTLILWILREHWGRRYFLFGVVPALFLSASLVVSQELRQRIHSNEYDRAGLVTKQLLSPADRDGLVAVGPEPGNLLRALFYLDSASATHHVARDQQEFTQLLSSTEKEWLLVFGEYRLPHTLFSSFSAAGFTLLRIDPEMDFSRPSWPLLVANHSGFSGTEPWGTWSVGKVVRLSFANPLPRRFRLLLKARAFGPNLGQPFSVSAGHEGAKTAFSLGAEPTAIELEVDNAGGSNSLYFTVPHPISPQELGNSEDTRPLGIGFYQLSLSPI